MHILVNQRSLAVECIFEINWVMGKFQIDQNTLHLLKPRGVFSFNDWNLFFSLYLNFHFQVFYGNDDAKDVTFQTLKNPIMSRFVRFQPIMWTGDVPCLRVEVFNTSLTKGNQGVSFSNLTLVELLAQTTTVDQLICHKPGNLIVSAIICTTGALPVS